VIFIEEDRAPVSDAIGDLDRFFRIVLVTRGKRRPVFPLDAPFHVWVSSECVGDFVRENAIEWYASWFVGKAPDIGFRGVLPGGSRESVRAALRHIRRAEAGSRVVVDYERLHSLAKGMRRRTRKIVFTNGVFDLLHVGHLRLLEQARALGDALIVAINSDDSARKIKGPGRPVIPQFARAQLLVSLRPVDACFIFSEANPTRALETVRPDVLVKGSEYPMRRIVGARLVSGYGGRVVRLPMVAGWSTTSTIRAVHAGPEARMGEAPVNSP